MDWRGHVLVSIRISIDTELHPAVDLDVVDGLELLAGEIVVAAIGCAISPRHEVSQRGVIALRQALFATRFSAEVPSGWRRGRGRC
jgi:hypothetical protein